MQKKTLWRDREPVTNIPTDSIKNYMEQVGSFPEISSVAKTICERRCDWTLPQLKGIDGIASTKNKEHYLDALEIISNAIYNKVRILVWGDYDVDGMTATAALYKTLQLCGAKVEWTIPVRDESGHGLNVELVKKRVIAPALIITVDSGITNVSEVETLKREGYFVLITDHHLVQEEIPDTDIVNPKIFLTEADDEYMSPGVYVAAKLALIVANRFLDEVTWRKLHEYLAVLTAFGIVSDIIDLNPGMTAQLRYGLAALHNIEHIGIRSLITMCNIKDNQPITATTLAFSIVPKLNAAGRMSQPHMGMQILLMEDDTSFGNTNSLLAANSLKYLNSDRKIIEQQIYDEALVLAESLIVSFPHTLVLFKKDWYVGVLGIVAARILERFNVPTIVLTEVDGILSGSCRSPENIDLYEALQKLEHLLTQWGGHKVAAGLTMDPNNLDVFRQRFNEVVAEQPIQPVVIDIDADAKIVDLYDVQFQMFLRNFEPHGKTNLPIMLRIQRVTVIKVEIKSNSTTLVFRDEDGFYMTSNCYHAPEEYHTLTGSIVDIIVFPRATYFTGTTYTEWNIKDIKVKETSNETSKKTKYDTSRSRSQTGQRSSSDAEKTDKSGDRGTHVQTAVKLRSSATAEKAS